MDSGEWSGGNIKRPEYFFNIFFSFLRDCLLMGKNAMGRGERERERESVLAQI